MNHETKKLTAEPESLQSPCRTPDQRSSGKDALARIVRSGTGREEFIARQKALFVGETWSMSKKENLSLSDAAGVIATRTDKFPDLVTAGKNGQSLLAAKKAYHNYRSWAGKLGRVKGTKTPDVNNWQALIPKYKNSRVYARPGDDGFWVILANIYENENRLAMQYAYKLASMAWATKNESPAPSFGAVRHYYERHADRKAVAIARNGEEWFRNNIAGYISREAPEPDEVWSGDHHIFDCAVKVFDEERGLWTPVRPWLTAWVDWGSLYFIGYEIRTIYPNRDCIERSLRSAIEKNDGYPCQHIYIDNGKDYKARGLFEQVLKSDKEESGVKSIGESLGCQVHFAIPYNARAKIAERQFRVVCEQFSKLWESYRGSNPQKRPKQADAAWNDPESLPTLRQFIVAWEQWLAVIYHDSPSKGKALKGSTPKEARKLMQRCRPRLDALQIYKAFLRELPGKPRKIMRGGVVNGLKRSYRSEELWQLMSSETHVRVKVDPDDLSTAWIYTVDGREVGPASSKPMLAAMTNEDPETIEQLREEMRRNNRQIKETKKVSADRRDMGRWLHAPQAPIESTIFLPAAEPNKAAASKKTSKKKQVVPVDISIDYDPELESDLDDALRTQSSQLLDGQQSTYDEEDLAILEKMEHAEMERAFSE